MRRIADLRVKLFADGATLGDMVALYRLPYIRGFTTNPTLMHRAGIRDYVGFARDVLGAIPDRPISFEVFSDDFRDMECQAREIAGWGDHVYVKIPITNARGQPSRGLIHRLSHSGVKVNVTAVLTLPQVTESANISIFAGRIADTGRDPLPVMRRALIIASRAPSVEVIWASPRESFNVYQAEAAGCHIITMTTDILTKLALVGKDLDELSLETVKMFRDDAVKAGFLLQGQPT
jgi:transaldolase